MDLLFSQNLELPQGSFKFSELPWSEENEELLSTITLIFRRLQLSLSDPSQAREYPSNLLRTMIKRSLLLNHSEEEAEEIISKNIKRADFLQHAKIFSVCQGIEWTEEAEKKLQGLIEKAKASKDEDISKG